MMKFNIKRNGWGYTALQVECDGEFLFTDKEFLGEEDFQDNHCKLPVFVDTQLCIARIIHVLRKEAQSKKLFHTDFGSTYYINGVLAYITENMQSSLRTAEVAEHFSVSPTKLNQDFRSVTGTSLRQYLIELRLTRAHELLESGSSVP